MSSIESSILSQPIDRGRREWLLTAIANRIHASLNLQEILNATVREIRQFLQTDRVIAYQFQPDWSGIVVAESVTAGWDALLGKTIVDPHFAEHMVEPYRNGRIQVTDDVHQDVNQGGLTPCHVQFLLEIQVKSIIVVPILMGDTLWGLLAAQECRQARHWQTAETELLQQLATHIGIAIRQATTIAQARAELQTRCEVECSLRTVNRSLQMLSDCNRALVRATSESALLQDICRIIVEKGGYYRAELDDLVSEPAPDGFLHVATCQAAIALLLRDRQGKTFAGLSIYASAADAFPANEVALLEELADNLNYGILALRDRAEQHQAKIALQELNAALETRVVRRTEALQEAQRLIESITDSIPGITYIVSYQEQRIPYISRQVEEMLGYNPDRVLGMEVTSLPLLCHPDDFGKLSQNWHAIAARSDSEVWELEVRLRDARGYYCWFSMREKVFKRDEHGKVLQYLGFAEDISVRKAAELAVEASEKHLNAIVANISDGILLLDRDGVVHFANPSAERMFGLTADRLTGYNLGIPVSINESFEMEILRFQGNMGIGEMRVVPVEWDGKPAFIASLRDVTERREAESNMQKLLKELTDFKYALDRAAIVTITDTLGNYVYANDQFCQTTGFSRAEIIGQSPRLLKSHYHGSEFYQELWATVLGGNVWRGEILNCAKDKSYFWVDATIVPFLDRLGRPFQYIAIYWDITARKAAETALKESETHLQTYNEQLILSNAELARATRMKDEFLASMSHELRTPLNAILGLTEGLLEEIFGPLNDRQKKSLATVDRSGRHLLELISDILDLAKVESGKLELEIAETSVKRLCDSSLTFVQPLALKKQIQLMARVPDNPQITVDELRMRQVLINLLNNAVKFTPEGGSVMLAASVEPPILGEESPPPESYLAISVTDSGIGIAKENREKLFEKFVQLDSRLNRQYAGTGLGLALVKQLVELHGGTVAVESEAGKGSSFIVRLPYQLQSQLQSQLQLSTIPAAPPPNEVRAAIGSPRAGASALILIVEDNEANISSMWSYLESRGYRLLLGKNGLEGVNLAIAEKPDIILMDIQMPGMDGLEAMRQIRAHAETAQTPIVALTALAMNGDREACFAAGANEYLAKPVKLRQLNQTIQQLLPHPPAPSPSKGDGCFGGIEQYGLL